MNEMDLEKALKRLNQLRSLDLIQCREDVERIVTNKITDENYIESTLSRTLNYYGEEEFLELFWKLINYVETFDTGIGASSRRLEETLNEGY